MNKSHKKEIILDENEKNEENEKNDDFDKNDENSAIRIVEGEMQTVRVQNQIKSIIYLFLLSGLYFGAYIFNYLVRQNILRRCRNSIGIIYEIVILYVLSLLILKEKYHKHHYLSISIIVLTLTALFIIYINKLNDSSIYNAFWYYLVYYVLYGSFNISIKKYFLVYFYSIYFVLLLIGAFVCVPLLLYDIIAFFVNKDVSGVLIGFANNVNSVKSVFLFIVDLLFLFISNLGIFWTIYYFTPFYLIISEFISELLNYYIQLIQYKQGQDIEDGNFLFANYNIAIFSVIFFINLICSLIFNEIIILKFCKLEHFTKKYIKDRATSDASSLLAEEFSSNSENEVHVNDN